MIFIYNSYISNIFCQFFERAIHEQLTEYFNNHFHPFLSAFRSGYGCMSCQLLSVVPTLTHCFLLVR
jgi:hypothetical protein